MKARGFVALMSAIVISAVLLIIAVTGSFTVFFGRGNILDAELKSRSAAAADACAEQAFLLIANDPTYTGLSVFTFNSLDSCRVEVSGDSPKSLRIQATSSRAVTNLEINYDPDIPSVLSWREVPVF
jgi:hypothetical protein